MNKKISIGTIAIATIILLSGCVEEPPVASGEWEKFEGNPVLAHGPDGAWDYHKTDPTVLKDNGRYKMWYGTANQEGKHTVIGYAESDNGIDWVKNPEPVLLPGPDDSWDAGYEDMETPTVIIDEEAAPEERYKMWYSAFLGPAGKPETELFRIGYATSPDGINWNKYKEGPVLDLGDKEKVDWDGWTVTDPMVIKEIGAYKMWYSGAGIVPEEETWHFWIGYATSSDGIHWQKYEGNPVLDIGPAGSFESRAVGQPSVVVSDGMYEMLYSGWSEIDAAWISDIGYASSPDGIHWTKADNNPALARGNQGEWDADQLVAPSMLLDGEEYKMYYTGMKVEKILGQVVEFKIGIGLATEGVE